MIYSNQTNTHQLGDRFIPLRSCLDLEQARFKLQYSEEQTSYQPSNNILQQVPSHMYLREYVKLLWSVTGMEITKRILPFIPDNKSNIKEGKRTVIKELDWSVYPRKKPLLPRGPDNIVLFDEYSFLSSVRIDWSKNGYLYCIFDNMVSGMLYTDNLAVHKNNERIHHTFIPAGNVLRLDTDSKRLAVANNFTINVWCLKTLKILYTCKCDMYSCGARSLCWDATNKFLVSGCSTGMMSLWMGRICANSIAAHRFSIIKLCMNADNKYLCSVCLGFNVRIWKFPSLKPLFEMRFNDPPDVAFHPWQANVLAVGVASVISLWNVTQIKEIGSKRIDRYSRVNCLTWSPLSGELVTCIESLVSDTHSVLVLSSLNKVVDKILYKAQVEYMLWSPDGTTLVILDKSENLAFWSFFGFEAEVYKKKQAKRVQRPRSTVRLWECIR